MNHFDEHTLCFYTEGPITAQQLKDLLDGALRRLNALGLGTIESKYNVNLVENREGKYLNFGYVRVHDKRFYHALVGNNLDGSERVEWFRPANSSSPTSEAKSSPSAKSISSSLSISSPSNQSVKSPITAKKRWGDDDDDYGPMATPATSPSVPTKTTWADEEPEDLSRRRKIVKEESKVGMEKKALPALITLGKYAYTPQQKTGDDVEGTVDITRAKVKDDPNIKHNVLFSQLRGARVSKEDVFDAFAVYGVAPVIKIEGGICYAEFSRGSMEAQFVHFMCHKLNVKGQTVIFGKSNSAPPEKKRHQRNQRW